MPSTAQVESLVSQNPEMLETDQRPRKKRVSFDQTLHASIQPANMIELNMDDTSSETNIDGPHEYILPDAYPPLISTAPEDSLPDQDTIDEL